MAVSGRKLANFPGSTSNTLEDDADDNCDPCLTIGQHITAHGFCTDCNEYLCKNCFECHQRTKASKDHQLIDKSCMDKHSVSSRASIECTEKCHMHKKEVIKFFCKKHKVLGCTDCMTMDHRTCDLDYIPDKCAGVRDSEEYREIMSELDRKVKEVENIFEQATIKNSQIDSCHENAVKEIRKFRKEIDDDLDEKQKKMEIVVNERKSTDKHKIQRVLETSNSVTSEMKKVQSRLQDNTAAKQDAKLYITIKRAKCKLSSNEVKDAEKALEDTNVSYAFERNKDLQNVLSKSNDFGTLNSHAADIPRKKAPFDGLTFVRNISVKNTLDRRILFIPGCAVLGSNKVLLADRNNLKLSVLNTESKVITEEITLNSKPWDIAVLPQDQIAVTMPQEREILILSTAGKLSIIRKIQVKGECVCITYHKDNLYVALCKPASVVSMDIQGNVRRKIMTQNKMFKNQRYFVVSDDSSTIYVSEQTSHSLMRITLNGEILSTFQHGDLQDPEGIVILDDGSLLVCSYGNNAILHISGDLKHCRKVASVENPQCICYNRHQHEIYIGTYNREVAVFSLK